MDTTEEHASAESVLLDEYAGILEQISETPYQRALHLKHIDITKKLGLPQELDGAREMMSSYWPLSEAMWLEWIADRKSQLPQSPVEDLTPHMELLELYKRAVAEYLSIPLLVSYSQFTIGSYYVSQGLSAPVEATDEDEPMEDVERKVGEADEILGALFGLESVRGVCQEILEVGGAHLVESQSLWKVWRDFEMDLLKLNPGPEQVAHVDALYLARLSVPHIELESTFSEYSSFITKFDNQHYDSKLPAANKLYSNAKKPLELREPEEAKLKKAGYADWAYLRYTNWELSVPRPDQRLVMVLFERAIKDFPSSVEMWDAYLEFANSMPKKHSILLQVAERAIKHLPESGSLWAANLRAAEKNQQGSDVVEGLFQRAMSTGLLDGSMDDLVALYEARAGFHRREVDSVIANPDDIEPGMIDLVVAILEEGIEKISDISKHGDGDPQMRLEKYLLRQLERFGRINEASKLWEELTEAQPRSYAVWYGRADFETRMGHFRKAHEVYIAGCAARFLDYPEYLLEAWLTFERQNGTLSDLEFTITKVKRQQKKIASRRQQEAMAAAAKAEPVASTSATTESFIAAAVQGEVDGGKKRERSPAAAEAAPAKKVKFEPASEEVKRDRENSTVFVIGEAGAEFSEEDLKKLFSDCGAIRECKLKTIGEQTFAMVEFMDRETVLAARTKDKKKINGTEVQVSIAWQACLYITNFPEVFDKAAIEELFSKYGVIFDTRWPSKRFKNTRRFCYVQFTAAADAQAALALHGTELEPGLKLTVYVSDPGRKKGRTDAGANNKELYVAGLSKFVAEIDLKRLFEPFGAIKGIRLNLDDRGECKGYAFVEFEDEASAQASLTLNNHELKKRRMSVTIAQPRATGTMRPHEGVRERKIDVEARSLRIRGIAPGTEEAIVQQAFEKHAVVKLVTMEVGATEAIVELESAAETGRILLIKDTITIDGNPVEIVQEGPAARLVPGKAYEDPKSAGGNAPLLPRQAGRSRGRVGLAGGRGGRGRSGIGAAGVAALQAVGAGAAASGSGEAGGSTSGAGGGGAGGKSQDDFRALLGKKA